MEQVKINTKVKLNKNKNNALIECCALSNDEMKEMGFTNYQTSFWSYFEMIDKRNSIEFCLTLNDKDSKDYRIDVIDSDYCQPYDYQAMIIDNSTNNVALGTHKKVQKIMQRFAEKKIIKGYNPGDYI